MTPIVISFQTALQEELKGLFFDFRFLLQQGKSMQMCYFSTLKQHQPTSNYRHYITLHLPEKITLENTKMQAQLCVQKAILDLKQAGHL